MLPPVLLLTLFLPFALCSACVVIDQIPFLGTITPPLTNTTTTNTSCLELRKPPVGLTSYTLGASLSSLAPAASHSWTHPLARHDITVAAEAVDGAPAEVQCGRSAGRCRLDTAPVCLCEAAGADELVVTVRLLGPSGAPPAPGWGAVRMVADTSLDAVTAYRILVGVGLALLAGWMASSRLVRLVISISLCVGLSVLILGIILYRSLPGRTALSWVALAFPSAAAGAVLWVVRDPSVFTQGLLSNRWVQAYVATAAAIGFILEGRYRPSRDVEASLEQLIRIAGLFLVYTASASQGFSFALTAVVAVMVFRSVWWPSLWYIVGLVSAKDNRPATPYRARETESFYEESSEQAQPVTPRRHQQHQQQQQQYATPSPRKRTITFEEYEAEGQRETAKAVSELKAYLKSSSPILSQLTPRALEALAREYAEEARRREGGRGDDDDINFSDDDD
jgi:hypothetical protein